MLKRLLPCLLALAMAGRAVSQTPPEIQSVLDRLDKLEDENRRLLDEIRALRSELTEHNAPERLEERVDVQETRTAELDQTKVGAAQRFPVSLTGMLLFNAFQNGRNAGTNQYPVVAAFNRAPSTAGGTLRQTVIGLKFNGPDLPGGGKASGSVYMDFFAGSTTPDNNLVHLRIATLDLNWKNTTVSVGQDKPIIAPREPVSLAQVGLSPLTAAGNLWNWNPQARVERRFPLGENTGIRAQVGVYETTETTIGIPAALVNTLEQSRPSYEGRFEFYHGGERRRIELAPGFHFGSTHVAGSSVQSNIASFDWLFRPAHAFEFTGAVFRGQDVAGLGALQSFRVLAAGNAIPIHTHGEWGQFALFPAARLSFHVYSGEQFNRPFDIAPGAINRNLVFAGNLMYKFAPNVIAAFEASQTRTEYLNVGLRLNNHYDLALAYLF